MLTNKKILEFKLRDLLVAAVFIPFSPHSVGGTCEIIGSIYSLPSEYGSAPTYITRNPVTTSKVVEPALAQPVFSAGYGSSKALVRSTTSSILLDKKNWAIQDTIYQRNINAFRQQFPADKIARRELLKQSGALQTAYSAGSLPIVKQILAWEPISETGLAHSNGYVSLIVNSWARADPSRRIEWPAANFPPESDYVELMRISLGANGRLDNDWESLATLSSFTPSADVLNAATLLLKHGAPVVFDAKHPRTALSYAAAKMNGDLVRLILASRQVKQEVLDGAIVYSPMNSKNDLVRLLLEHGANINADETQFGDSSKSYTPLLSAIHFAKLDGDYNLLPLLIKYKANPNKRSRLNTRTALMLALHHHDLMRALLELGADPNVQDDDGDTALTLATRIPKVVRASAEDMRTINEIEPGIDPEMRRRSVELLLKYGANVNATSANGRTALDHTGSKDAATVKLLIANGAKVSASALKASFRKSYDVAPQVGELSAALLHGNDALAAALLAKEGKIGANNCAAVYYAAVTGSTETLKLLLNMKADVYAASDINGKTALIAAAEVGQLDTIKLLLDRKVSNINETTQYKIEIGDVPIPWPTGLRTALMMAAANEKIPVIEELLKRGANRNQKDAELKTALDYAKTEKAKAAFN